eukprot:CAMPEP_0183722694 /NCGR_PEP_ID=MMETSP0737-20130205/14571_1 /TAXON_ID=385413 /ORGANISM="Thalassiosira miniscula, Strain CCMP1093" /LENGTH=70 /DNA_ID=CAMNT_0025952905 /DNA_START=232 /DNA_END=444 /DNA_ORIENTATION=-
MMMEAHTQQGEAIFDAVHHTLSTDEVLMHVPAGLLYIQDFHAQMRGLILVSMTTDVGKPNEDRDHMIVKL